MDSKQTDSNEKKPALESYRTESRKEKVPVPSQEEIDVVVNNMLHQNSKSSNTILESPFAEQRVNLIDTGNNIHSKDRNDIMDSLQTESTESNGVTRPTIPKRISSKQRKESLEEYQQTFLSVPTLEDRKPVFISREVRDRLDEIARKLGGRRMSVSGFIENLARHHLEIYQDDVEGWKKL